MKSWNEFVNERNQKVFSYNPHETLVDIICPSCNCQLYIDNTITLASNPPQKLYFCKNCGWKGTSF